MGHSESEWEADARAIVSAELRVPVDHQDTGGKGALDGTPDALIDPDGARIQMETVRDIDPRYARLQDALEKFGSRILSLDDKGWLVTITHDAQVKRLHDQLAQLLVTHGSQSEDPYTHVPEPLRRIGVASAWRFPGHHINISTVGAASWDRDIPPLNTWVERTLDHNQDVAQKLRALGGGHAFLWASTTSPVNIHSLIAGIDGQLPGSSPALPAGVHRIWVAGFHRASAIWTEGDGWHRARRPSGPPSD
ncbi:hypothetical protein [Leifsonia shinshuensis]